jgi:deoxyribodipyrimidine photo-lyase
MLNAGGVEISIWWIRRDIRIDDNSTLYHALQSGYQVLPLFVFDKEITDSFERDDNRLIFIYNRLSELKVLLEKYGSSLWIYYGNVKQAFESILKVYTVRAIYAGIDYEPYSIRRDQQVQDWSRERGIGFFGYHDHVIMDPSIILKSDGLPYTVFTPYSKRWMEEYTRCSGRKFETGSLMHKLLRTDPVAMPEPDQLNIRIKQMSFPSDKIKNDILARYEEFRDFPGRNGTTRIGIHLRFGTISIRNLARIAAGLSLVFLKELIWRDFYQMILYWFPQVVTRSFKPAYDNLVWHNRPADFDAWCQGRTGYPLVDAGMHELVETGFMHNRVRMVTASFLTKHLLIDWRLGEAFFSRYLLDYELASNNGGWQWAAGSGCDAAPYFRVFNPARQQAIFDPDSSYVMAWLPGYQNSILSPKPIIEHVVARERALAFFKQYL